MDYDHWRHQVHTPGLEVPPPDIFHSSVHDVRVEDFKSRSKGQIFARLHFRQKKHNKTIYQLTLGLPLLPLHPQQLRVDLRLPRNRTGQLVQLLPEHRKGV